MNFGNNFSTGQYPGGFQQGGNGNIMVGNYRGANNLPPEIDQFVKSQRPEVSMAQIISVQTQVVSGINYKIVYRTPKGENY